MLRRTLLALTGVLGIALVLAGCSAPLKPETPADKTKPIVELL